MTTVKRVDSLDPDPAALAEAARLLRSGRLVAFPTETVYGLGAHALDAEAVRRIFAAKGRPADNPLIVHVADVAGARAVTAAWPEVAERLAAAFWPGPLTLVLPKAPDLPDEVTAGLDSVGVRIPSHPVALALLRAAGVPIAAPSANPYTGVSPTTAEHVSRGLGDRVDLVLDGGPCRVGIESTVLSLLGPRPRVLRLGMIGLEQLATVAPDVEGPRAPDGPKRSPGLAEKHYAPRARLELVEGPLPADPEGAGVADLVRGPAAEGGDRVVIALPDDPEGYAAGLYAALHQVDALGCERVRVAMPPDEPAWAAVRDRLSRAAWQ